jgi:hypothetical protein
LPAVVDVQIDQAIASLTRRAAALDVVEGDAERALWEAHATSIWSEAGAVVRASWLPANITAAIAELARLKPCATPNDMAQGVSPADPDVAQAFRPAAPGVAQGFSPAFSSPAFIGRAAIGAGLININGETEAQASAIAQLRGSAVFGNVVIVRGSVQLKARVDVWGSHGDRQPLFDSLKRAFDPNGVLNAGRGPL